MFTPENLVFLSTNLDPLIRCFRKVMLVQICIFYIQSPLDRNAHVRKIVIFPLLIAKLFYLLVQSI